MVFMAESRLEVQVLLVVTFISSDRVSRLFFRVSKKFIIILLFIPGARPLDFIHILSQA